jgi:hypothetical protein
MMQPISISAQRGLIPLEEKHMTKISLAIAALVLASAASTAAFAAMPNTRPAITQGEAYNRCEAEFAPNDRHSYPEVEACVQRLTHVNQSNSD